MPTFTHHHTAAASERRLLNLFAPTTVDRQPDGAERGRDLTSLWRADAIHRAKNLAQLSVALGVVVDAPMGQEVVAAARSLARAYEALAFDNDNSAQVPCIDVISNVVLGLGVMFGRARDIKVTVSGIETFMSAEHRRAVTLMCSELVINALKYAFPTGQPGTVAVTIGPHPDGIELAVSDDGVGLKDAEKAAGQGDGLLGRLAHVTGATMYRSFVHNGRGLRIGIILAVPMSGDIVVRCPM